MSGYWSIAERILCFSVESNVQTALDAADTNVPAVMGQAREPVDAVEAAERMTARAVAATELRAVVPAPGAVKLVRGAGPRGDLRASDAPAVLAKACFAAFAAPAPAATSGEF